MIIILIVCINSIEKECFGGCKVGTSQGNSKITNLNARMGYGNKNLREINLWHK